MRAKSVLSYNGICAINDLVIMRLQCIIFTTFTAMFDVQIQIIAPSGTNNVI